MSSPQGNGPDRLPLRWALILLAGFVVGCVFGGLTYVQTDVAPALLAGLAAMGATTLGLDKVLP